jgi:GntR family transcriptional regulator / MocR family aminotransferase
LAFIPPMRTELFRSLELDRHRGLSMRQQLSDELRRAVIDGRVRSGARLPSTRHIAEELGVARNTAVAAFEQLIAEGYLESKHGSGTFVVPALPERSILGPKRSSQNPTGGRSRFRVSAQGQWLTKFRIPGLDPSGPPLPFRPSVPALDLFPQALWNRIRSRLARSLPATLYTYGDAAGYAPLRRVIANYLRAARGVRCTWQQIVVVSGAQQALDLASRLLLNPGDSAIVENPGHPGAWAAFRAVGAKLVPVEVDESGLIVEEQRPLPEARVACVCPSHQYPLGGTLPLRRRLALLAWAHQQRAWIIEDDYDSEFRYTGGPLPALQGLDRFGCVLYMGTFSKVLHPALRLGYLLVPDHLVDAFTTIKAIADRQAPLLEQAVLASFIEEGHFGRHTRRMRMAYLDRQGALLRAIEDRLEGALDVKPAEAGFHVVGWLPSGNNDAAISNALYREGIECPALSQYSMGTRLRPGLMLGYAGFSARQLSRAVTNLAAQLNVLKIRQDEALQLQCRRSGR